MSPVRLRGAVAALALAAGLVTGLASPARAGTAAGTIITNFVAIDWTTVWGVTATGAQFTQTSSTCYASVAATQLLLQIQKNLTGGGAIGAPLQYDIVVTNTGSVTVTALTIVDTVSPLVVGAAAQTPAGWGAPVVTSVPTGTRFIWSGTGLSFEPGSTTTFAITGNTGVVCAPSALSNSVWVGASDGGTDVAVVAGGARATILPASVSLLVHADLTPAMPSVGNPVKYRIVVTNAGNATIDSLTVVDTLASAIGASLLEQPAAFGAPVATSTASGTRYVWTGSALGFLQGAAFTFTITGVVGAVCVDTAVSNTPFAVGAAACTATVAAGAATAGFVIAAPIVDATVTTVAAGGDGIGAAVSYTITVANTGEATITGLTIVDTVSPVMVNKAAVTPPGWSAPVVTSSAGGTIYAWSGTGIALAPGTSTVFGISGSLGMVCAATQVSTTAMAVGGVSCSRIARVGAAAGVLVQPSVVEVLVQKTSTGGAAVGSAVSFSILVTNTGSATITALRVFDTVSPVVAGATAGTPPGWSAPVVTQGPSGTIYAWSGSGLTFLPGTTTTFTVSGTVGTVTMATAVSNTGFAVASAACGSIAIPTNCAGFAVTPPAAIYAVLGTSPATQSVGSPIIVSLSVTNTGGAAVSGLVPSTPLVTGAGMVFYFDGPYPAPPVALGGGESVTFTWTYTAGSAGAVVFSVTVSGTDVASGGTLKAVKAVPETIQTAAVLSEALATTVPSPLGARQPVTIVLTLSNSGDAPVTDAYGSAGAGAAPAAAGELVSGPLPVGPVTIPGHGSVSFTWVVQGLQAGLVTFTVTVTAQDGNSGLPLVASVTTAALLVSADGRLVSTAETVPVEVKEGETAEFRFTVENTGVSDVQSIVPTLTLGDAGLAKVVSGPVPAGGLTLTATGSVVFVWTLSAKKAGHLVLTGDADGIDSNSKAPLSTGYESFLEIRSARFFAAGKGKILVAPNVLDMSDPACEIHLVCRGKANGHVTITIYDEAHRWVAELPLVLDWSGLGEISTKSGKLEEMRLGQGVYWAVAKGGGVDDVMPFIVVVKRKLE